MDSEELSSSTQQQTPTKMNEDEINLALITILNRQIMDLEMAVDNYRCTFKLMHQYIAENGLPPFWQARMKITKHKR